MESLTTNIIIAAIVVGSLVGLYFMRGFLSGGTTISSDEAHELVDGGALLVDVRTAQEFAGGHIDEAVNIPLAQVQSRLEEFGERDSPIVLYCRSGARSGQAQGLLEAEGFTQVNNLGGIGAW